MFEHYTERAKKTTIFAKYEAGRLGSSKIGCQHLLIALVRDADLKNRFLRDSSVKEIVASMPSQTIGQTEGSVPFDLPLSREAREALILAKEEAAKLGSRHVDNEHILLGLLRAEDCSAAKLLQLSADDVSTQLASAPLIRVDDTVVSRHQRQDAEEEPPQPHQQGPSERHVLNQISEFLSKGEERNALKLVDDMLGAEGPDRNRLLRMYCPLGMAIARQIADFPLLRVYCERLLTIKPNDIRTLSILADCLNQQGQTEAANHYAKRCYDLSIGREDDQATRIIRLLAERFPSLRNDHT